MKLAVYTRAATPAVVQSIDIEPSQLSFRACRALLSHQPPRVAALIGRLVGATDKAIRKGAPDRFLRARRLEEAVCYVAGLRPTHEESQRLQLCVTRLLHEHFATPEWRAPFIAGLR
jgi:hypothetical protein